MTSRPHRRQRWDGWPINCTSVRAVVAGYGEREQTRTDHLRLVLQYSGWRLPRSLENKELEEFLLARVMEHDSPSLLFGLACEHLRTSQLVRPGVVRLIEGSPRREPERNGKPTIDWPTC